MLTCRLIRRQLCEEASVSSGYNIKLVTYFKKVFYQIAKYTLKGENKRSIDKAPSNNDIKPWGGRSQMILWRQLKNIDKQCMILNTRWRGNKISILYMGYLWTTLMCNNFICVVCKILFTLVLINSILHYKPQLNWTTF